MDKKKSPQKGTNTTHKYTNNNSNYFYEILKKLKGVKQTKHDQFIALCPAHDDHEPSLSIAYKNGKVLLHCFKGCSYKDIIHALGLNHSNNNHSTNSNNNHSTNSNNNHSTNSVKKIHLRLISNDADHRFVFKDPSEVDLHEPTEHDLEQIQQNLGKRWCLETLRVLGVKICKKPYALALWDTEQVNFNLGSNACYYVEGRTDLITLYDAINIDKSNGTPTHDAKHSIVSRYNVKAPITLLDGATEHVFILDADDTPENVIDKITNRTKDTKLKFIHLDGSKDLSDFFYKDGKDVFDLQRLITETDYYKVKETFVFWNEVKEGKRTKLEIKDALLYKLICNEFGYSILKLNDTNERIVKVMDKIVKFATLGDLRKDVNDYILDISNEQISETFTKHDLHEYYNRSLNFYIQEAKLQANAQRVRLDNFASSGANYSYVYFKDKFVLVSSKGTIVKSYDELDGFVWDAHRINHDIKLFNIDEIDTFEALERAFGGFCFYEFLKKISNGENDFQPARFETVVKAIGYLLHDYNHPSKSFAIIFTDETLSDEPSGRTGKSLLVQQAIGRVRKVATIDGKNFDKNNRFKYQQVEPDTNIIFYNDVPKNFYFEALFTAITDQFDAERKNKEPFTFPTLRRPKIAIATNYPISGISASFRARRRDVMISTYYNDERTPEMEFGKRFFDDFDDDEWNKFYNLMIWCLSRYLKNPNVPDTPSEIATKHKLIGETSKDFVEWVEACFEPKDKLITSELFKDFIEFTGNDKICTRQFGRYLNKYFKIYDLKYKQTTERLDKKKVRCYIKHR